MTADELLKEMLENVPDDYQKTVGYPLYDILSAFALSLADTDAQLDKATLSLDPANLSGTDLAKYVYQRRGLTPRAATAAVTELDITGTGTIAAGDLFETTSGIQFSADSDTVISGIGSVRVTAVNAGSIGNVAAGTITKMPITIPGIATCSNSAAACDGYDRETDADLIDRFYTSLAEPTVSGNAAHYRQWALEVSGVGYAQVFPLARGANTVEVMVIDADGKAAGAELIARVQEHIDPESAGLGDGTAPIGAHCYVITPSEMLVNVSVSVTASADADHDTIAASMRENLEMYLSTEVLMKKNIVSYGKMYAYCSATDGIDDIADDLTLNGMRGSLTIPTQKIARLGEVTISYA